MVWFNRYADTATAVAYRGLMGTKGSFDTGRTLFMNYTSASLGGKTNCFAVSQAGLSNPSSTANDTLPSTNGWHHVAYTYDDTASPKISIYLDGIFLPLAVTNNIQDKISQTNEKYSIPGGSLGGAGHKGLADDYVVIQGITLSSNQVYSYYQSSTNRH
jgi:hypothetical protein